MTFGVQHLPASGDADTLLFSDNSHIGLGESANATIV